MIRSEQMFHPRRFGLLAVAAAAALLLGGCGPKKDASAADPSASEVAATVNGQDLSVQQLTIALQKQRGGRADASDAASRQALEQLIDEEIIAQKAVAAKLDKDPRVIQQLDAARRDILARRFIEAAAETAAKPDDNQVRKFYDGHASMFAQRQIFKLQRLDIQAPDDRRNEIDAHVQSFHSPTELTDWLKAQNLRFTVKQEENPSEQLSMAVLEKVSGLKDGASVVIPSQFGVSALTRLSATPAPKTLADARPAIEQYLSVQGRREVVMNLQKTNRDGAKIVYQGKFSAPPAAPASAGVPGPSAPASAPAPSVSAAPVAASNVAAPASQNIPAQK